MARAARARRGGECGSRAQARDARGGGVIDADTFGCGARRTAPTPWTRRSPSCAFRSARNTNRARTSVRQELAAERERSSLRDEDGGENKQDALDAAARSDYAPPGPGRLVESVLRAASHSQTHVICAAAMDAPSTTSARCRAGSSPSSRTNARLSFNARVSPRFCRCRAAPPRESRPRSSRPPPSSLSREKRSRREESRESGWVPGKKRRDPPGSPRLGAAFELRVDDAGAAGFAPERFALVAVPFPEGGRDVLFRGRVS